MEECRSAGPVALSAPRARKHASPCPLRGRAVNDFPRKTRLTPVLSPPPFEFENSLVTYSTPTLTKPSALCIPSRRTGVRPQRARDCILLRGARRRTHGSPCAARGQPLVDFARGAKGPRLPCHPSAPPFRSPNPFWALNPFWLSRGAPLYPVMRGAPTRGRPPAAAARAAAPTPHGLRRPAPGAAARSPSSRFYTSSTRDTGRAGSKGPGAPRSPLAALLGASAARAARAQARPVAHVEGLELNSRQPTHPTPPILQSAKKPPPSHSVILEVHEHM
jgi:hypothetical protein